LLLKRVHFLEDFSCLLLETEGWKDHLLFVVLKI